MTRPGDGEAQELECLSGQQGPLKPANSEKQTQWDVTQPATCHQTSRRRTLALKASFPCRLAPGLTEPPRQGCLPWGSFAGCLAGSCQRLASGGSPTSAGSPIPALKTGNAWGRLAPELSWPPTNGLKEQPVYSQVKLL